MHPSSELENLFTYEVAPSIFGAPLIHLCDNLFWPRRPMFATRNANIHEPPLARIDRPRPFEDRFVQFQGGHERDRPVLAREEASKRGLMLDRFKNVAQWPVRHIFFKEE
jgi:hypothetical protein